MFHLRVRVPDRLKTRVGMLEVRRSLHVYDHRTARLLALKYTARVLELFEMVEKIEIPTPQIQAMVRDLFRDLRPMAEKPMLFPSGLPDLEREEQKGYAAEAIDKFTQELESQDFNALTERRTLALLHRAGIEPLLVDETSKDPRYSYRVFFLEKVVNSRGKADEVVEFVKATSAEGEKAARFLLKEAEKPKYKPAQIVKKMQEEGCPNFKLHHHAQLWTDLDARNPARAFGVYLKDNDWWWYENWLDRVRLHCDEHRARYA